MKAAVFFDSYLPFHQTKDPGLITIGLNKLGCDTSLVTELKSDLYNYEAPFQLIASQPHEFRESDFWSRVDADAVICYTWLDSSFNHVLQAILKSGRKVVVKSDSDGRVGYPVVPRRYATLMDNAVGRLLYGFASRNRAKQIEMASAVLIESPKALTNISRYLAYWDFSELGSKFRFIPNPVTDDISNGKIRKKENILISIGNWHLAPKNAAVMMKSVLAFLNENKDWTARLVGPGDELLRGIVSNWKAKIGNRVEIIGQVPHEDVANLLSDSRIFFMPSKWESFGIAAAEAVCMGCTIVGTPLEPLDFLVADGFSGTLAEDFDSRHLVDALDIEATKHHQGHYSPPAIAHHWRERLSLKSIASQIRELLATL